MSEDMGYGLDMSKVTPSQLAFMAKEDPQALTNGLRHFQTSQQGAQLVGALGSPEADAALASVDKPVGALSQVAAAPAMPVAAPPAVGPSEGPLSQVPQYKDRAPIDMQAMLAQFVPQDDSSQKYLAMAAAFGRPTGFGTLGETMSNVASALQEQKMNQQKLSAQYVPLIMQQVAAQQARDENHQFAAQQAMIAQQQHRDNLQAQIDARAQATADRIAAGKDAADAARAGRVDPPAQIISTPEGVFERTRDGSLTALKNPSTDAPLSSSNGMGYGAGMTPEEVSALDRAVVNGLDPYKINSRTGPIFAKMELESPGRKWNELGATAAFDRNAGVMNSKALLNTISPLLDGLVTSGKKLTDTGSPMLNAPLQVVQKYVLPDAMGGAAVTGFDNLRDDTLAEVERGLMGTGVLSDSKYQRALKNLNSTQTQEQRAAAVDNIKFVIKTRLESLANGPFQPGGQAGPQPASLPGANDQAKTVNFGDLK
jgi:hypothetical protein